MPTYRRLGSLADDGSRGYFRMQAEVESWLQAIGPVEVVAPPDHEHPGFIVRAVELVMFVQMVGDPPHVEELAEQRPFTSADFASNVRDRSSPTNRWTAPSPTAEASG